MELARSGKNGAPPKSVAMTLMFWMNDDGVIHLSTNDKAEAAEKFHVAVSNDGTKPNGHPSLYRNLEKCLKASGAKMPGNVK